MALCVELAKRRAGARLAHVRQTPLLTETPFVPGMITCDSGQILNTDDKFKFLKMPSEADKACLVARNSPRTAMCSIDWRALGGQPVAASKGEGQRAG